MSNVIKQIVCALLLASVLALISACQPIMPIVEQPQESQRPDAPPYAMRGPFVVGARDLVIEQGEESIALTVWYPALNSEGAQERGEYIVNNQLPAVREIWYPPLQEQEIQLLLDGNALLDAPSDLNNGPYPLVLFSVGLAGFRQAHSSLLEHLASHGFVVIAWDPRGETFDSFWASAATRPIDARHIVDYAELLAAPNGELAGLMDMEHIAIVGHSAGGTTALWQGGALMSLGWCTANADLITDFTNCAEYPPHQEEIAAMLGLESAPQGLWPSLYDARVDAIVPMAPDGDTWGAEYEGVEVVAIPALLMTGSIDTFIKPDGAAFEIYEHLGSSKKSLVVFENADHMIFWRHCRNVPWISEFNNWACSDPVWDRDRTVDLTNHFVTSFLLAELKEDTEAASTLAPENVNFPGIRYETTAYTSLNGRVR